MGISLRAPRDARHVRQARAGRGKAEDFRLCAENRLSGRARAVRRLYPRTLYRGGTRRLRGVHRPRTGQAVHLLLPPAGAQALRRTRLRRHFARDAAGDVFGHRDAPRHAGKGQAALGKEVLRHALPAGGDDGDAHALQREKALPSAFQLLYRHRARFPGRDLPQHRQLRQSLQIRRRNGALFR